MKSVQIRSFLWSVFFRIWTEYGVSLRIQSECGKIQTRKNSVFGNFPRSDGHLLKTRTNLESRLRFSECSFSFLPNSVIFCVFYQLGYMAGGSAPFNSRIRCQRLARLKGLRDLIKYYSSWNHQKIYDFLMTSGGILLVY